MTTYDFGDGLVAAHRHSNGQGWVADTAQVDPTAFVSKTALVYGNALISGNAQVSGNAHVYGHALVSGDAHVYGMMRSDSYCFTAVACADRRNRVMAEGHYFTREEALAHWNEKHPRYDETKAILDYFIVTKQL